MAKYNAALYDVDVYAATVGASDVHFGDGSINAVALTESQVRIDWRVPTSAFLRLRIVRSTFGLPPDPVSGQSVTLIDVDWTDPQDPGLTTTSLTDTVTPGAEVFYGMFVHVADPTQPLVRRWVAVAFTTIRLVRYRNSFGRLAAAVPAAFMSSTGGEVGGNPDSDEPMTLVLQAMGDVWDSLLTDADRLLNAWDARKTPTRLLPSMAATLGLPIEPALGPKPQRALIANGSRLWALKSTTEGVRILSECATGTDITVGIGKNLLPSTEVSAFEGLTSLASALSAPVTSTGQTTITVTSTEDWPILRGETFLTQPLWIIVTSSNGGTEIMEVTACTGTALTVKRAQFGTAAAASHEVGAVVLYQLVQPAWTVQPGYHTYTVTQTDTGFTMPSATSTASDQPPLQSHALAIKKVVTSSSYAVPELGYGATRYVAQYERINNLGFVRTYTPSQLQVGQRVRALFGTASAVSNTEATYQVINIIDRYMFVIQHTEGTLPDATMDTSSQFATVAPPYVIGLPLAATMLPATPGETYTYSAYIRAAATSRTTRATISFWDETGAQVGSTTLSTGLADDSSQWLRVQVTATAPAKAVLMSVSLRWNAVNWATGETHYVTQQQVEHNSVASSYDDGGLVRVGMGTRADIDPQGVVRQRTRQLLKDNCGDSHSYRVEFMVRRALLPTGSTYARLAFDPTLPQTLGTIDIRVRLYADNLNDWMILCSGDDATNTTQFEFMMGPQSFRLLTLTGPPTNGQGDPYGTGNYGAGPFGGKGAANAATSTAHSLIPQTTNWVRVTRDRDTGDVTFYTAPDSDTEPYNWTIISTVHGPTGNFSLPVTTVEIGNDAGSGLIGRLYSTKIGVPGADIVVFDPWLYDDGRTVVPNSGVAGGDWVLSTMLPDVMSIGTSLP